MELEPPRRRDALLLALGFEGGLLVLALCLGWLLDEPPLAHIRWGSWDAALGVAATLPLLLGFMMCLRWPVGPLRRIRGFADEVIRSYFGGCTLLDLAAVALLAGLGEEMLFRGVLQGVLGRWLGPWLGLVVASIAFGLVHPITPFNVLLAALAGLYLGALYLWTDNLLTAALPHALYDWAALAFLVRGKEAR